MTGNSKYATLALCGLFLLGCGRGEPGADEPMEGDTAAMAPEPMSMGSLADYAGTWNVKVMNEAGDSVTSYQLMATAEESGWTINFPNREPIPVQIVEAAGDSVSTVAGPFESALRPGVQVTTESVFRLQGDRLVGTTVAHYATTGADSVVTLRSEGTRGM